MVWRTYLFDNSYALEKCQKLCHLEKPLRPITPKSESPYYPDRKHSKENTVKGTSEESSWKNKSDQQVAQENVLNLEAKKLLNII